MHISLTRRASIPLWFLWHVVAVIAIVLIPDQLMINQAPSLKTYRDLFFVGLAIAYSVSVIILTLWLWAKRQVRFTELSSIFFPIFCGFFLFLLISKHEYSRSILILALFLVAVFSLSSLILTSSLQKVALVLALAFIVLIPWARSVQRSRPPEIVLERRLIRSSFYNLVARYHHNFVRQEVSGGAISRFGDRYLLAAGNGQLYSVLWDGKQRKLESTKLPVRVPVNRDEFARDVANDKTISSRHFRTADILVQDLGANFRLFASHHYWNREKRQITVRVSSLSGSYSKFAAGEECAWQTVYESRPPLTFKDTGDPFAGYDVGGRLALLDSKRLLLTVGDHEFDGVYAKSMLSQDAGADYGKTILIDLDSNQSSIYSLGHRNPQGLFVDPVGDIWLTEHGPKGGDELNMVLQGKNYGWPMVTLGTDYSSSSMWPLNASQNRHEGFEPPVYAWIPSIGISAITGVQGKLFKIWKDDLLVSSLKDKSIWRVRLDKGRVTFTERIEIGERIRDIMEDADGRLVLWTEKAIEPPCQTAIVIVEPIVEADGQALEGLSNIERGELLFGRCSGCHQIRDGAGHGIGPDLKGIYQAPIAAAKGFNFSQALRSHRGTWTEENLDLYMKDPGSFVPGTSMQFKGISDPAERASLIAYFKAQKSSGY